MKEGKDNRSYNVTDEEEKPPIYTINQDDDMEPPEDKFLYDVHENPNVLMATGFALQLEETLIPHVLLSLSRSLSTSLLVADVLCAREDENTKAKLLSTTLFISGLCTLLQNLVGIRIPLYQGPAASYVVPLIAMMELKSWECPSFDITTLVSKNITDANNQVTSIFVNETRTDKEYMSSEITDRAGKMAGSLMIAGAVHLLIGGTGLVGIVIRWIGPVTVIPTLTITALVVYRATARFAGAHMGIAYLTVALAIIFSLYMRNMNTPFPSFNRKKKECGIKWFPAQKMFSVLLACFMGWGISGIITWAGGFSDDPDSHEFYARTDSRLYVIAETDWFRWPYPGQFGPLGFDTGALITFMLGTLSSVIDSIGDYYACAKVINAPPPPTHAINRGLLIEGTMSFFGGWTGAGHATSTFGGNIGAIGITRVASLRVFQIVGVIFILFGIIGKIGAVFITIPYSVIGGMMMINFGVLIGVMLGNMQFIDMNSTRNLAIIGIAMLVALVMPEWLNKNPDVVDTGSNKGNETINMLLGNPAFLAGFLACFLDNTVPGTQEERGMIAWKQGMGIDSKGVDAQEAKVAPKSAWEQDRMQKLLKTAYTVPYADKLLKCAPFLKYLPFYPKSDDSSM